MRTRNFRATLPVSCILALTACGMQSLRIDASASAITRAPVVAAAEPVVSRSASLEPSVDPYPGARPPPGSARSLSLPTTPVAPTIDGRIDDEAWASAIRTGAFWVVVQEEWPQEPTEVLVTTDGNTLYFAFVAFDSDPDGIRALETVRDRGLGFDDQVIVQIDSFMDHESISSFSVNALGTQDDSIAGGRASRISWKGDWDAAVARTAEGWTAEMAIPYEILNYRPEAEEFAINFGRYHYRTRERSWWADVSPQDKPEEMGRLLGVTPSDAGRDVWTVMPFAVAGVNVPDQEDELQDELFSSGVDVRFAPSSNLTGVLSLNPDFTQVESQITDANFSYNEKGVGDERPFFAEGEDYLGGDRRMFYSPRIPDFDAGTKAFGQYGAFRYGGFVTSSPDSQTDAVARMSYALDRTHSASIIMVGSENDARRGNTVGVSASGREARGTIWDVTTARADRSEQGEPESSGSMYEASAGWRGDHLSGGVTFDRYDREFLPVNSLINRDLLGTHSAETYVSHYRNFGDERISETSLSAVHTNRKTRDGRTQYEGWYTGGSIELNSFVRTSLSYSDGHYRPVVGDVPGDFGDLVNHDRYWTLGADFNTRSSSLGYGVSYSDGFLGGGDYQYTIGYAWARPTPRSSVQLSTERLESFGVYRQYVVEAGWDFTAVSSLVFRHVYFDGDDFVRLGYRRVVRNGLDVFALYDDGPTNDPAISVKVLMTIF